MSRGRPPGGPASGREAQGRLAQWCLSPGEAEESALREGDRAWSGKVANSSDDGM